MDDLSEQQGYVGMEFTLDGKEYKAIEPINTPTCKGCVFYDADSSSMDACYRAPTCHGDNIDDLWMLIFVPKN